MAALPVKQNGMVTGPMAESLLGVIAQAAANPDVDVDKMLALLNMQERILERDAKRQFDQAMKALNEYDLRVEKAGTGSFGAGKGTYKYAKWEDMDTLVRPLMRPLGLWFSFDTEDMPGGRIKVIGTLHHEGGHSRSASIPLYQDTGPGRNNNQAMGSTTSYGKRYTAEMLLNIVREDEDDDGNGGRAVQAPPRQEPVKAAAKVEPTFMERAEAALAKETGERWLKLLCVIVSKAPTLDDLAALRGVNSVKRTMASKATPEDVKDRIMAAFDDASERLAHPHEPTGSVGGATPGNGNDLAGTGANGTHAQASTAGSEGVAVRAEVEKLANSLAADKDESESAEDDGWPGP